MGGRNSRLTEGLQGLFQGAEPPEALRASLGAEAERRFGAREPVVADVMAPELVSHAIGAAEASTRRPFVLLRGAAWASGLAAAAAALFLVIKEPAKEAGPQGVAVAAAQPDPALPIDARDIDGSGTVDIFDAYLVARAASNGEPTTGMPDLDEDGLITRADADRIARFAVEVPR